MEFEAEKLHCFNANTADVAKSFIHPTTEEGLLCEILSGRPRSDETPFRATIAQAISCSCAVKRGQSIAVHRGSFRLRIDSGRNAFMDPPWGAFHDQR
jgi:hypothetical protein